MKGCSMSNKKDNSLEVRKVNGVQLPDWMRGEEHLGTENLQDFVIPPRIKIVQATSKDLLETYRAGDVILTPTNTVILEPDRDDRGNLDEDGKRSFNFVPLFFFPEWATWNDIKLKGQEPAIRYRTTDPSDPIVAKARDKNLREEPIPGNEKFKMRHVEHLNYVVTLVDHPLSGQPMIFSFSRGEWFAGSNLASLLKMRRAPIFGCVFTAVLAFRRGNLGDWYGLDITNPSDRTPWTDESAYGGFKQLHEEFKEHYKNQVLKATLDDGEPAPEDAAATPSEEF